MGVKQDSVISNCLSTGFQNNFAKAEINIAGLFYGKREKSALDKGDGFILLIKFCLETVGISGLIQHRPYTDLKK